MEELSVDVDSVLKANRFVPDRGFKGAEDATADREGPVQFKKAEELDPFGIDEFLGENGGIPVQGKSKPYGLNDTEEHEDKRRRL